MAHPIPERIIRRIKEAANIVDVIAENVVLKKSGRNHLGLCPFHAEKTPSFTVNEEKQIFYCFGCHMGGTVFNFIMQRQGVSFPEAVRTVAAKYGIEVPDETLSPSLRQKLSEKEQLLQINEAAMNFYSSMLNNERSGRKALAYLSDRGMNRKIIDGFKVGYAPEAWDALLNRARSKKVAPELLEKCGLVISRKDKSGFYDRFRDRIIFPIFNASEQVIGFGGRVMGDELPKYLNSPETPVFNKSRCLYGIHKARLIARSTARLFVVEGYFDVLALHLYGIENSVATLGTALTLEHVDQMKGMVGSGQVILVFDSDQAGIAAARRSISIFEEKLLEARILVLPKGYDPDLYLREKGAEAFLRAAENALGIVPFLMDSAVEKHGLSIEGKVKVVAELQEILATIQDTVARALYIKRLAERLDVDEFAILEKIRQREPKTLFQAGPQELSQGTGMGSDAQRLEERIVSILLRFPAMRAKIVKRGILDKFQDLHLKRIAQSVSEISSDDHHAVTDWIDEIEDDKYRNLISQMALEEEHLDRVGCERVLSQFEAHNERRANEDLQHQIKEAEKDNNIDLLCKLLQQKQRQAGKGRINGHRLQEAELDG